MIIDHNPFSEQIHASIEDLKDLIPGLCRLTDVHMVDAIYNSLIRFAPTVMLDEAVLGTSLLSMSRLGGIDIDIVLKLVTAEKQHMDNLDRGRGK